MATEAYSNFNILMQYYGNSTIPGSIVYTERNPNSWSTHNFTQANNKKTIIIKNDYRKPYFRVQIAGALVAPTLYSRKVGIQ